MKKLSFFILAAFLFVNLTNIFGATATIKTFEKVEKGKGTRLWQGDPVFVCPFEISTDCKVTVTEKKTCDVQSNSNGFILTVTINEIVCTNLSTNESVSSQVENSYLYNGEFSLRIEDCSEYPALIGVTVDIPTIMLNQDKSFQLFIPIQPN